MSRYHKVAVWETPQGWRAGFYERISRGFDNWDDPDGYDSEWGDEYGSEFEYVSPHAYPDPDAAVFAAPYPNPGGHDEWRDIPENAERIKSFEQKAWDCEHPEEAKVRKEAEELERRKKSLLSCVMPVDGDQAIIEELDASGSGTTYQVNVYREDDGSLIGARIDHNGKRKTVTILTPTGRVPKGSKISGIKKHFPMPGLWDRMNPPRVTKPNPRACSAPTPKGPCQRQTYSTRCWQHS